jgi:hypothetical protein
MLSDKKATEWINSYKSKFKREPTNYSITAYNGVLVIADAIDRTVKANKPVNRTNIRDAIQNASLKGTLQGDIAFDANGDILSKVAALYQDDKDGKWNYEEDFWAREAAGGVGAGGAMWPFLPIECITDILLQQVVNGLALGMMYALASASMMVYGIIEQSTSPTSASSDRRSSTRCSTCWATGSSPSLTGLSLVGTLLVVFPAYGPSGS